MYSDDDTHLYYSKGMFACHAYDDAHVTHPYLFQLVCTVEEFNNYKGDEVNNSKTVRDAAIKFKGEWPHDELACIIHDNIGQRWSFRHESPWPLSDMWHHVSTYKEFNDYVGSMSRHAGAELYERYVRVKKSPLTKVAEPVYTQEMNDNGALPSVGMKFLDSGSFSKDVRVCLFVDGDRVVYHGEGPNYNSATLAECEPLTSPVELIDGKACQFDYNNGTEGMLNVAMRYNECTGAFVFDQYTFKPEHCTNIKPLTVGE
tara:strand:- start:517 stop:1293 length:777 start_codon:yes stop_codon:yes gene_type:complete